MDECSLPKARPILCNESPAFQRHHMSLFCAAESPNRFPWVINTTFGEKTYIRWCCNDRLSSQRLRGSGPAWPVKIPAINGYDQTLVLSCIRLARRGAVPVPAKISSSALLSALESTLNPFSGTRDGRFLLR